MQSATQPAAVATGCPFANQAPSFPFPRECPVHPALGYKQLQQDDSIIKVKIWNGSTAWLVTRLEDFKALLVDPRISADTTNPAYPPVNGGVDVLRTRYRTLNSMDAPEHTVRRRMVAKEFTAKRVSQMRVTVDGIVDELLTTLRKGPQPFDFVEELAFPLATQMICELLGVPYADRDYFQSRAKLMSSGRTTVAEAVAAGEELCEGFIGDLIKRKQKDPQGDMLSRLVVDYLVPGHLSMHEMISTARQLLVAGHETTANTSALSMLALLQNPEQFALLRADPSLLDNAVEELLRYCDPTHSGRRRVPLQDIQIRDTLIPAGDGIIIHNIIANRDPATFADADRLDLRRANANMQVAFSYGPHVCLGQGFARVELQGLFNGIIRHMPTIRLAVPFEQLEFKHELQIYGLESLPVAW